MDPLSQLPPTVSVVTSHGRQELTGGADERVLDLLARHGVPWSAVSAYLVPRSGGEPELRACLEQRLGELSDASEVLIYFNRNVNPFMFSLGGFTTIDSATPGPQGTEYLYQRLDNEHGTAEAFLKKLDPDECKAVIAERVVETILEAIPAGSKLVIGVSGGGDSNALLHGLSQLTEHGLELHPVIIMGIPDWDAGVPRALELCDSYGLELTIMQENEVKALLHIPEEPLSLIHRFEREFKGDDFEFLGTLLIRLALAKRARELETRFICTGLNLEDVLCEGLFRVSSGLKPASIPTRTIGETTLVVPLWLCPKRIIDGCFPKLSLDNYEARYPCVSLGRNLYYSVVYAMQSQFPGFVEQLAHGMSEASLRDPVTYTLDEQLGFHVERMVPFPARRKFERMTGAAVARL
jgi:tRNA(Ile)-lysidine synthase TilS/MesJ